MSDRAKDKINATTLSLETLPLVDKGSVALQFNELLQQLVADCEARHAVDKDRALTMKVLLRPVTKESGVFDHVDVEFDFGSKVPGFSTGSMPMLPRHGSRLLFQPLSPDDPRQDPLPNLKPGERMDEDGQVHEE